MIWLALASFAVFLIIGVPIVFALGLASALTLWLMSEIPLMIIAQRMVGQVDSFTLLAVPFFVFVGEVMDRGGIAKRLVRVAVCLVGHFRGGLAQVNIVTSLLFSGISGSSAADASAVGSMMIPAMVKRGYTREFSAAVTASSATIGPIIPPSTLAIIYGAIAGVPIGQLFLAGIIPGILICVGLMLCVRLLAPRLDLPVEPRASYGELIKASADAGLALVVPVIVLLGIVFGVFTPTEAGAVAAIYALVVSIFVYGELRFRDLPAVFRKTVITTSVVMIIISSAGLFAWILASENLPFIMRDAILALTENRYLVLILMIALMLAIGAVMEIVAAGIIMIPVLYPVAIYFGFDEIHFAMLIILTMSIGAVTPPVGITLFITLGISGANMNKVTIAILPFLLVLVVVTMMVAFIPQLTTFLPELLMRR